jgi:gliding motility-associated-like protein
MKQTLLTNRYNLPIESKTQSHRHGVIIRSLITFLFIGLSFCSNAQNPSCDPTVPYFYVDLSSSSTGTWSSPNVVRKDQCCNAANSDDCISFDVALNPGTAGIQIDMVGADPSGSLFYSIDCQGSFPGGTIKCISGAGPHHITFCKPGGNSNVYIITAISRPIFPDDDSVRIGCSKQLISMGVVSTATNWTSIYPGAVGAYNSYLGCTNCASPVYTPASSAPFYVDYRVCGSPQASNCGFAATICDTVRIYNISPLSGSINPASAGFCNVGPGSGVTLTGVGIGGMPPYTYIWRNSSNVIVGTSPTYFASQTGNISLEVHDAFYNSSTCPAFYTSTSVIQNVLPLVSAGTDQKVCATNPSVSLNGTVSNSAGGTWSGGTGVFNQGSSFLNVNYTPSTAEINNGSVTLTLTATPSGGCPVVSDQVTISFSDTIHVNISSTPINCYGGNSTITAQVSGGTLPFSYLWNNGSQSASTNVGQGNYSVTVTDAIGCSGQRAFNVTSPSQLTISLSATDVTTNGGNDGSASVVVNGGTAPYSFNWTPGNPFGDGSSSISNLTFGIYSVLVTDANGCSISGSVVVNEPSCAGFSVTATSSNVTCNGANDGIGTGIVSGGEMPFSFSWSDPLSQTDATAVNLAPGAYTLTVIDNLNCISTTNILITQPQVLINSISSVNVSMVGGSNGSATANTSGGTMPYSFDWSSGNPSGDGTSTISDLSAGTYSVTITDLNGCSVSDDVIISDPSCAALSINIVTTDVSCFGENTGSAIANVSGATPPYIVQWSNGETGNKINDITAGNYSVIITDAVNCSQTISFTISQPAILSMSSSHKNLTCFGSNNGLIDLVVNGGTFPYSFNWSNGSINEDLVNLGPGNYSAQITDGNGCFVNASETILEPGVLSAFIEITSPNCMSSSDGAIDLTVSGGNAPYSFEWSTGQTTEDVSGIQAGGFSVLVSDANGCVTQPSPLIFPVSQPMNLVATTLVSDYNGFGVSCNGSTDGSIDLTVEGGTMPYSYSWSNNENIEDLSVLSAGSYSVSVTDAHGCATQTTAVISEPATLVSSSVKKDSDCNGIATGTINLTVSGGAGTYVFDWSNGLSTEDILNIGPGNYSVTITDKNGCTAFSSMSISQPSMISVVASISNITCMSGTNGSIEMSVNGGTPPYSYEWSNGATTEDLNGLMAGEYSILVKDANGCTMAIPSLFFTLSQPSELIAVAEITSSFNGENISCHGASDGTATVVVSGGTIPYSFSWSNSETEQSIKGLDATTYSVVVTDANGCFVGSSVTLSQPEKVELNIAAISDYNGFGVSCFNSNDGSIDVNTTGGILPYTYSWNNGVSTEDLSNLNAGAYSVIVADANGCTDSEDAMIKQPEQIIPDLNSKNVGCNGTASGSVDLSVSGGVAPYQFSWNNGSSAEDLVALPIGSYSVDITDLNGCKVSTSAAINEPAALQSEIEKQDVLCFGQSNGSIIMGVRGGTEPYTYNWSNGSTGGSLSNLPTGIYTVTIIDALGCQRTDNIEILQPDSLYIHPSSAELVVGYNISSFLGNDGSIDLAVHGGTSEYSFMWSDNSTTQNIGNLTAGVYSVVCADANGCRAEASIELDDPMPLEMPTGYTPNGDGNNDNFIVHGIESYTNNSLTVFNRWGNIVYQKQNYFNEWNGENLKGDELPDGTYFVILEINEGGLVLKGYVEMKRY